MKIPWRKPGSAGLRAPPPPSLAATEIALAGRRVPLRLRRSKRARRMLLKLDIGSGGIELVLPPRATEAQARHFLDQNKGWLTAHLGDLAPPIRFADGVAVPILGVEHVIRWQPERRGAVRRSGRDILVGGAPEHLNRRVTDWLKAEARREIAPRARAQALKVDRRVTRISLRDTRSRWGSCSVRGSLSFSWRLILAPEWVVAYVVAHEVAHLVEMNHGQRFWALVNRLAADADGARAWLRSSGPMLHRYGG